MKTLSSIVRKIMVRAGGGVKRSPTLKQVKGPTKSAFNKKRR